MGDLKIHVLKEHPSWVTGVEFSSDGRYFGTIDQNGTATVWSINDLQNFTMIKHNEFNGEALIHFSNDNTCFITSFGKMAQVWTIKDGNEIVRRAHSVGYLWDAQFSPDGKFIATASTDCSVRLWLWKPEDMIQDACECVNGIVTHEIWEKRFGKDYS